MHRSTRSRAFKGGLAGLAGIALLGAACSSSSSNNESAGQINEAGEFEAEYIIEDDSTPTTGGTVVMGLGAESEGLDPVASRWAGQAYTVGFTIFDPLAAYDVNTDPVPYLAEALTPNEDFTQWTITLRPGITFHNGEALDAEAVVANLEAQRESFLTAPALAFVEDVSAVDATNVRVDMNKPWSTFPHVLTAQVGVPMAPSTIGASDAGRKPVGTGPFVLDEWIPNKELKVSRNADYWQKDADGTQLPYLDSITFQPLTDIQNRGNALISGSIDILETNDPTQIQEMTERGAAGELQVYTDQNGESSEIFVGLNTKVAPFDDPIAREAVALAGDVESLSEIAFDGIFPPAYGPFSESSPYFVDPPWPRLNLEEAKRLNEEYKAKTGEYITFSANITPQPEVVNVAQVLQQQMAAANITVELKQMEQTQLIVDALNGNYQATGFILFGAPNLDREFVFFASEAKPVGEISLNFTRMDDPEITKAMEAARATGDKQEQIKQYGEVQKRMAENLNFLFLVRQQTALAFDNNVRGVRDYTLPGGETGLVSTSPFLVYTWLKQ